MMRKLLILIVAIAVVVAALAGYNHYDVISKGNAVVVADTPLLRTPDKYFDALSDFPFAPHYFEINDAEFGTMRVHYLDEGPRDGEVVVLLHGQATWSYSFRDMIPLFTTAGYRVIVPDLIGFGRSDKPADWKDHSFQRQVDWLEASLLALGINDATGFMFDWGGYFGLRLVVDHPELFSRLVLCTTTMPRANSLFGAVWVSGWRRYIYGPEEFPISGMVAEMVGNPLDADTIIGLDAPYPDESYKAGPRRMPMMIPATILHPTTAPNREAWDALKNWNKPTLTLVSESLAQQGFKPEEFHKQMPGTAGQPHETYPDTGFFLIEDVPEALAQKTIEFMESS
ncbi:MAG: haloalkane dehalogenase [Gammaproteobacteria bacterium]